MKINRNRSRMNSIDTKTKSAGVTRKTKFAIQKQSTIVSQKIARPIVRCFVKLDRTAVDNHQIAEMKRTAVVRNPVGRPRKVLSPAVTPVAKRKLSPVVAAVKATIGSAQRQKISAVATKPNRPVGRPKSIIAGHDKALLKHTTTITSKRTPKPNRRYINDQTVTKVPVASSDSEQDDDEEEEQEQASESDEEMEPEKVVRKEVKSIKKVNLDDDWTEDDERDVDSPVPQQQRQPKVVKSEPPRKRGRPPKSEAAKAASALKAREVASSKGVGLNKRKLDLDTSDAEPSGRRIQIKKKIRHERPPSPTDSDSEEDSDSTPTQPPARGRKPNSSQNAHSSATHQPTRNPSSTKGDNGNQLAAKRSALSATLKLKQLNHSAPGSHFDRSGKSAPSKSSVSADTSPISSPKFYGRKRSSLALAQPTASQNKSKNIIVEPVDLEDFEQMPTFTIVNINDIINQKEDVVVIEKKVKPTIKRKAVELDDDDDDYKPSDEDMSDKEQVEISRRKTHPTAMRNRTENMKNPPKILNSTIGRQYRNNMKQNDSPVVVPSPKGAPRILNSTLCRNASSVEPRVLNDSLNSSNVANNRPKSNVVRTFSNPRMAAKPAQQPTKTVITQQVMQGGTTRRVRKITCFETWFVIKMPAEDQPTHMAELTLSLVHLGNEISQVPLPSDQWSYNISLLRKNSIFKKNHEATPNDDEVYTGEVQDANIKHEERHMYVPSNIMFRRKSQNPSLRMQFDRAVICKNKKFYINIEGKNLKLLAAPAKLECLSDIETLLQIVNDLTLGSPLVEQTSYIA